MSKIAQPATHQTVGAASPSSAWYDAVVSANQAWLHACTGCVGALASAAQIQAQFAGEMMKLWLGDTRSAATFAEGAGLVEQGLLMAEGEGERFAEAARETLYRMGGGATIIPLPE